MTARRGPMRRDLDKAAAQAKLTDRDAAVLQLARTYAGLLDDARFWADQARKSVEDAELSGDDVAVRRAQAVGRAVDAYRVAERLGPRLLAALAALGLTGRPAEGGVPADDQASATLLELRGRRRRSA